MSEILGSPVLASSVTAADFGSGTGGLLVFVLLGAVSIGLFIAMSRSLKRMRANVDSGRFADQSRSTGRSVGADDTRTDGADATGRGEAVRQKSADKVPGQGHGPDGG